MLQADSRNLLWSCNEIAITALAKAQDDAEMIVQNSIQSGEIVQKKLP